MELTQSKQEIAFPSGNSKALQKQSIHCVKTHTRSSPLTPCPGFSTKIVSSKGVPNGQPLMDISSQADHPNSPLWAIIPNTAILPRLRWMGAAFMKMAGSRTVFPCAGPANHERWIRQSMSASLVTGFLLIIVKCPLFSADMSCNVVNHFSSCFLFSAAEFLTLDRAIQNGPVWGCSNVKIHFQHCQGPVNCAFLLMWWAILDLCKKWARENFLSKTIH